ncbi:MAG: hypothetical protein K2H12_06065 [Acetatifactor sp.]|nr:hypothetical protein [Acetatifactor sp.]
MTENEFLKLEIGTVIFEKSKEDTYFIIYDTDQMGTAYRGNKYRVYGAKQIDCDTHFVRISISNYPFWDIKEKN